MTMSSQGCSLMFHLPQSTSRSAAPYPAVLRNWFALTQKKECLMLSHLHCLFQCLAFFFSLLGDSPVQLLSQVWLCSAWALTVSQPEVLQTECYLQKPSVSELLGCFSLHKEPPCSPTVRWGTAGTKQPLSPSHNQQTDCQDEHFGAELSKVPLKPACVSLSRSTLWMLRLCSCDQWYC